MGSRQPVLLTIAIACIACLGSICVQADDIPSIQAEDGIVTVTSSDLVVNNASGGTAVSIGALQQQLSDVSATVPTVLPNVSQMLYSLVPQFSSACVSMVNTSVLHAKVYYSEAGFSSAILKNINVTLRDKSSGQVLWTSTVTGQSQRSTKSIDVDLSLPDAVQITGSQSMQFQAVLPTDAFLLPAQTPSVTTDVDPTSGGCPLPALFDAHNNQYVSLQGESSTSNYFSVNFSATSVLQSSIRSMTVEYWALDRGSRTNRKFPFSYSTKIFSGGHDNGVITENTPRGGGRSLSLFLRTPLCTYASTDKRDGWHHYAFSYDYDGRTLVIYVDGIAVKTCTGVNQIETPGKGLLVLGQEQDEHGGGFDISQAFTGSYDELRWWNTARSASDIRGSMCSTLPRATPNLIVSYSFDNGSLRSIPDGADLSGQSTVYKEVLFTRQSPAGLQPYCPI